MRLTALAVSACILAALSACSSETSEPAPAPAPVEPAAVLAGVDLTKPVRVAGTEPFWAIELTGTEMVYSGVDRPEQRAPQPHPLVQGTVANYQATTTSGTKIAIMLAATECSDGMSDRVYPLTAQVKVGEEELSGCAAPSAAVAAAGESGPVIEAAQPAA